MVRVADRRVERDDEEVAVRADRLWHSKVPAEGIEFVVEPFRSNEGPGGNDGDHGNRYTCLLCSRDGTEVEFVTDD
jgi:hypothetical protein